MKVLEGIKDFIYDFIDYIIIIGIIGIVVFVISWRLDLLFANDALDMPPTSSIVVDNDEKDKDIEEDPKIDPADDDIGQEADTDLTEGDNVDILPPETNSTTVVKVSIPSGSLPGKIGSILEEKGLIASGADFIQKSQDMKLDTKLQSGEYEIQSGSSLEEIVKIIAHR